MIYKVNKADNFLIVTIDTSRLSEFIILYAVEGVTPEIFANSFILIFLSSHRFLNLSATTSLTLILHSPQIIFLLLFSL